MLSWLDDGVLVAVGELLGDVGLPQLIFIILLSIYFWAGGLPVCSWVTIFNMMRLLGRRRLVGVGEWLLCHFGFGLVFDLVVFVYSIFAV